MRSSAIIPILAAFLSSSVYALPYSVPCSSEDQGNPTQIPVTRATTDGYITGVPAPISTEEESYITGVPSPSSTAEGYITGVLAPSSSTDEYITGVPVPSSTYNGYITGVPVPSSTDDGYMTGLLSPSATDDGYLTGVPTPSSSCTDEGSLTGVPSPTSESQYITGVPGPSSTGGSFGNSTDLPTFSYIASSTESGASTLPTPSQSAVCRPTTWTREGHAPSVGKLRAALIFVDFPDAPSTVAPSVLYSDFSTNAADLYAQMSYGKLSLEIVPLLDQFYRMPSDSSSYNYSRALTTEMHLKYINDAVTAAGPAISFTDIDALYIMTNTEAKEISFSTSTKAPITAADGTTISNSITYGQDLYFSWGYKTINHETGHTMGLPDLYPYGGGDVPQWVGGYDIMGLIGGQSPDYFAWHKWQLDWIEDSQVDCVITSGTSTHTLSPIEIAGATSPTKAIAVPINSTAYVMVEARSTFGIDEEACGTGVLLYTADAAVGSGDGPVRVIDSKVQSTSNHACTADKGGELNDAPLKAGEFLDTGLGVVVSVVAMEGEDYVVEVERSL